MLPPTGDGEASRAYDDYASEPEQSLGRITGAAMGGEFDVNRLAKIDEEALF